MSTTKLVQLNKLSFCPSVTILAFYLKFNLPLHFLSYVSLKYSIKQKLILAR